MREDDRHPDLDKLPVVEEEYLFDEDDDPTETTIFTDDPEALSTTWITSNLYIPIDEIEDRYD